MKNHTPKQESYKGDAVGYKHDLGMVAFGNPLDYLEKRQNKKADDKRRHIERNAGKEKKGVSVVMTQKHGEL